MEVTDQQNHLKSVTEQAQTLVNEINQLEGAAKSKRDMLFKLQGIIEILTTNWCRTTQGRGNRTTCVC